MDEAVNYKTRYLAALREMEIEERRWRGIEQLLRRLVVRLCTVARGEDGRLNGHLESLSAAARRDAAEPELKTLFDALSDTAMALEMSGTVRAPPAPAAAPAPATTLAPAPATLPASAPVAAAPSPVVEPANVPINVGVDKVPERRWQASCNAVALLIDRLGRADSQGIDVAALHGDLAAAADDTAFAAVLERVAELAYKHSVTMERARAEAVATLSHVTAQLNEMVQYLSGANAERERGHKDTDTLNIELLANVARLSDEVKANNDLASLRALVSDRLEAVASGVRAFREREQHRFDQHAAASERMRSRLVAIEHESRELYRNLDLEKQRSRLDTLTTVSNRIAFDERFAEELARWGRLRHPVAILVWDVDLFKLINDECGHRGGDAVLREVAVCLNRGRREVDFFARFGGDEFVSLLVGTELADAMRVAEQMRVAVDALKFHFHGTPVQVTVSCGLTVLRDGDSADAVFDRADAALYKAKNSGRNACVAV